MSTARPALPGFVVALEKEAACVAARKPLPDRVVALNDGFLLFLCGQGPERAARATDALLDAGAAGVISIGTAGALDPVFAPGDLIVPEHVVRNDRSLPVDPAWRAAVFAALSNAPGAVAGGTLLTTDRILASREDKSAAHRESRAVAVDMESAAVLERAAARGARALVLRVVLDGANTTVPDLILHHADIYGRPRLGALCAALVGNPRQVVPFLRIAQGFAAATRTLRWLGRARHRFLAPT